jgi:hypothetical protein
MPGMSSSPLSPATGTGGAVASAAGMPSDTLFGMPIGGGGGGTVGMDPSAMQNMAANMQDLNQMAMWMGDTPDERTKNAQAFASLVGQLGKMGKDVAGSTIMQRIMKGRIRPIDTMAPPGAGGVAQLPSTLPPDIAQAVMSRMGYRS